jgi:hypothetical protein
MARRRYRRRVKRQPVPSIETHAHNPADGEPATHDGAKVCRDCGKVGRPGDAQHPHGALPLAEVRAARAAGTRTAVPDGWAEFEARMLGERDDLEDP